MRARWMCAVAALSMAACRTVSMDPEDQVSVAEAYFVKPAPDSPAVLYLQARNPTDTADTVTDVRLTGADSTRIHSTMSMGNGMEHMMAVASLPVPARDTVRLVPGGLHAMVFGAPSTLQPGDSVEVHVGFRRAGDISVWAQVITYAQVSSLMSGRN